MVFKLCGYTFTGPFQSADQLKEESGVYVVVSRESDNWKLIDCGESPNVKERIRSHERQQCWRDSAPGSRVEFFIKICEVKGRQMIASEILNQHQFPCRPFISKQLSQDLAQE